MTLRRVLGGVLVLLTGLVVGFVISVLAPGPLEPEQDAVVAGVPRESVSIEHRGTAGGYIEIQAVTSNASGVDPVPTDTLFVLYPGGLVRPQAYVWMGVALAPHGVRTVIPVMPLDLAVLAPGRAGALIGQYPEASTVLIGGHSLGGAMAARFAAGHPAEVDALILMGAFSAEADDLSARTLPAVALAAEHDGLATLTEVRDGMSRLPPDAELHVLAGAVHAFFGRYGPQRGDGTPTVTRAEAEAQIIERLETFVERVRRLP